LIDLRQFAPYLGDLHAVLPQHWAGIVLVAVSIFCGMLVGAERQFKQKAAGARTLTLICVGSTIFTMASVLMAGDDDDRTRIAAQVVSGVGFLGAGAIIRNRGTVVGLTTAATVWTVAAIGVLVGGGYAAAAIVLTVVIVIMLVVVHRLERTVLEPCRYADVQLVYDPAEGKTRVRILRVLDEYRVPDQAWELSQEGDREVMQLRYCHFHGSHRSILFDIVDLPGILAIRRDRHPRQAL
jgi:putative Mg2+ transporter-C (MgtC) family protein